MKKFLRNFWLFAALLLPWALHAQSFSYTTGFESDADTAGWVLLNGSQINKWYIGTPGANTGTQGLFVSNDGTAAAYTKTTVSFVYAYHEFTLTAGSHALSFDWKCYGESSYDFLRVFLAPATATFTPGSDPNGGSSAYTFASSAAPAGWIDLAGGKLNLQTSWQTYVNEFAVPADGTYNLIFVWANDGSSGTDPAACIDNIVFAQPTCARPANLVASNITANSVDLSWIETGYATEWEVICSSADTMIVQTATDTILTIMGLRSNTVYNVALRAVCGYDDTSMVVTTSFRTDCSALDFLPFTETFENQQTGGTSVSQAFIPCWNKLISAGTTSSYPYVSSSSSYNHTPSGSKGLYWYAPTSAGSYGDYECVVLPTIDTTIFEMNRLQLSFWARTSSSSYAPVIQVGVLGDANDVTTFQPVDTINISYLSATWNEHVVSLADFAGYGKNIALYVPLPQSSSWYVYIDDITIDLIPDCPRVENIVVNAVGPNSIDLSWTEMGSATGWNVTYYPEGTPASAALTEYATDTNIVLTDLHANTIYNVVVTVDCGSDVGGSNAATVRTACDVLDSLPYVQTFENENTTTSTPGAAFIPCWNLLCNAPVSGTQYPYVSSSTSYNHTPNGNKGLYWGAQSGASYGSYQCLVLPQIDTVEFPINTLQLNFWAKSSSTSYRPRFSVGVLTNPMDINTFVEVAQVDVTTTAWTEFEIPFTTYAGSAGNIAVRSIMTSSTWYAYVDDFTIGFAPTCLHVDDVQVTAGAAAARVTWSHPDPASYTGAAVEYKTVNESTWTSLATSDYSIALTGLADHTTYDLRVATICSSDSAEWQVTRFTTGGYPCAEVDNTTFVNDTIGTGSSTINYLPSYSFYDYSYTQQIYLSTEMAVYGGIESISLKPSAIVMPRHIKIYLAHTTESDLTNSFITSPDMTLVYDGTPTAVAGQWCNLSFTTPFVYNGGDNLLVTIVDVTGDYQSGNTYYATPAYAGCSRYIYQDNTPFNVGSVSGGTVLNVRNDIIFRGHGCLQEETCVAPLALVDSVSTNTISVSWVAGGAETAWNLLYRVAGDSVWSSAGSASLPSFTYANLTSGTDYELMVQSVCSGTPGAGAILYATTPCLPVAVPFSEDFEAMGGVVNEPCWYAGTTNLGTQYPYPVVVSLLGDTNKLCLLYNGAYLVLPSMDAPLNTLQVRFSLTQGADNCRLMLGILPYPTAPISQIMPLDTLICSQLTSEMDLTVIRRLDNLPAATTGNIVFYDAWDDYYSFIDNLVVETIPNCSNVESVAANNATVNSAELSWTTIGAAATSFIVEYGPRNFTPGTGTVVTANASPYTLTGLAASTTYDAYIYAVCSATHDTSVASSRLRFATACDVVTLPYRENFDGGDAGATRQNLPNCWNYKMLNASYATENYYPCVYLEDNYANSGIFSLRLYGQALTVLPEMPTTVDSLMLMFHEHNTSTSSYDLVVGAVDSITPGFENSFVPLDTLHFATADSDVMLFLANYTGTGRYIAFKNIYHNSTTGYSYHYIDDIYVDYLPSCLPVTDLRSTGNTNSSITVAWTDLRPATEWELSYSTTPLNDPATGTTAIINSNPYTITGLSGQSDYYVYVRTICGAGDTSMWSLSPIRVHPGTWNMRANVTDTLRMCGGVIYDEGGADGAYFTPNQNSYIVLMPDAPVMGVMVEGSHYTESTFDYITIYDGIGSTGAVLYDGYGTSGLTNFGSIESGDATGALTIYFHCDGSIFNAGFEINVSCFSPLCRTYNVRIDTTMAESSTELNVTWDNSAAEYEIEYGPAGFTHGNGTMLTSLTNSITITGLNALTTYDVYVRGICNATDTGSWAKGRLSTALCDNPEVVDMGTGTLDSDFLIPINTFYNYSFTEVIIDSAELGGANDFTAISLYYDHSEPISGKNNVEIFIQPTNKTTFTNETDVIVIDTTVATLVYQGALNCTQGWNMYGFTTPYSYNGNGNIAVIFRDNSGIYLSSSNTFRTVECNGYKTLTRYTDDSPLDFSGSDAYGEEMAEVLDYRPDMQLIACGTACAKPTITNETHTYGSISLTWTGTATDFEVSIKPTSAGAWPTETAVSATNYTFDGLSAATSYDVRVRQYCDSDLGYSDWAMRTIVTDELPCFTPDNLAVTATTFGSVTLNWTANTEDKWVVRVWRSDAEIIDTVTAHPTTINGLYAGMTYQAAVQAMCGNGAEYSDWSEPVTFTTEVCQPVTNVQVTVLSTTSAKVAWTAPTGSTAWQVNYGDMDFTQGQGTLVDATNPYTITGLEPDGYYDVYVRTNCGTDLYSDWSAKQTFQTGVGINDVEAQQVSLYPNPTNGNVTVAWDENDGMWNIEVVDLQGRVVKSMSNLTAATAQVNGLTTGTYFVRIYSATLSTVKKLIVR